MSRQAPLVFIMAAGLGTRMKSDTAKVLHKIAGRPMLHWVVGAARAAGAERVVAKLTAQQVPASIVSPAGRMTFAPDGRHLTFSTRRRDTGLWLLNGIEAAR